MESAVRCDCTWRCKSCLRNKRKGLIIVLGEGYDGSLCLKRQLFKGGLSLMRPLRQFLKVALAL